MDVKIKKLSSSQIELEIEIPASQIETYFQLAASELSKDMKIDGFRPGKVPIEIVEREKGSQKLYDEAANMAVSKTLPKAILDNNIEIIDRPDITVVQIARGNPLKYKATFWTMPEVELGNYKGLKIKGRELKVEDKEIENSLEYLQKSRAKLITVNCPAKSGHGVEIDFSIRENGIKIEGGESKNHPIILGEGRFMPGFEKELEGMKSGEEKKFTLLVPKDWTRKNLAGKNLEFEVKMNLVSERQIPRLSDEFAKSLGDFESLKHLKASLKEGIMEEKELKEKERIKTELIEKVADASSMNIPPILIEIELDKMIDEFKGSIESMNLDFDRYLKEIKKTVDPSPSAEGGRVEGLKKEWRHQAEKRVKIGLVLKEIAKKEKIEISEDEIVEKMVEGGRVDPQVLKEYTENVIRNEKVFQLLEREAKIS